MAGVMAWRRENRKSMAGVTAAWRRHHESVALIRRNESGDDGCGIVLL